MKLNLYVDEVKETRSTTGEIWLYCGILIVPVEKIENAYNALMERRVSKKGEVYQGELHFVKLSQAHKIEIARKWLSLLWSEIGNLFYFSIMGINKNKLNHDRFGEKKTRYIAMYNRFIRSQIKGALKLFFRDSHKVEVENIFHDQSSELEKDTIFDRHLIEKLNREKGPIRFNTNKIQFISSDHNSEPLNYKHSNFIQLVDILLGSVRTYFDATTTKEGPRKLSMKFSELFDEMRDDQWQYKKNKKCEITFFPKEKVSNYLLDRAKVHGLFYRYRTPALPDLMVEQKSLF